MPCESGPPTAEDFGVPELKNTVAKQKKELDKVTRLLCSLCKTLSNMHEFLRGKERSELRVWWEAHKKLDARREVRQAKIKKANEKRKKEEKEAEELRVSGLSKLSKKEVKALGINKK